MSLKSSIGDLFKLGEIKDNVISLFEAKFELKKLEIQEKVERGVAELIFAILLMILGSIVLVFVLILAAYGLNVWLGEPYGYVLILVLMLLTLGIVYNQKSEIKEKITETIQKEMDAMES